MKHESTTIKTLIIDPEPRIRHQITEALESQSAFVFVGSADSGREGLSQSISLLPDLVFLETALPDMSGFDFLHKVSPFVHPQFVLLSSSEESAVKAFEYFVFDYLLKPFTRERLQLTLIKIREHMDQQRNTHLHEKLNALFRYINPAQHSEKALGANGHSKLVPVKMSGRIYFIHPTDIEYVEAAGYYIEVFAKQKKHLIRQSLTQLVDILDKHHFVRIHRSVVINTRFLKEIIRDGTNDFSARMSNDSTFKISRSYKSDVFARIGL